MYGRVRLRRLADACLILVPYVIAFILNRSVIADVFSLVLFGLAIWFLKTPIRVLRTAYKVKGAEDIIDGAKKGRWRAWWVSPPIFGTTSYLYFILVRNNVVSFPEVIGLPQLSTILVLVLWWAIILILYTILMQFCWKEYLANVFHIGNDTIKKAKISFLQWTRTQDFLVKKLGLTEFQKYERVEFSFSMVLGLFVLLPSIFFAGGDFILDSLELVLVLYAMLFDPTGPFHDFEKLFYKRLLSDLRERHRSSFMVSILVLLALVGNDIASLESTQMITLLVRMISLFLALLVFFKMEKLARITRTLPYLASFWIFLTLFFTTQNSTLAIGFCLFPLIWYFLFSAIRVGIEDARRSTISKLVAYATLYAVASFTSTILFFIESGSFLTVLFLVFGQFLVVSMIEKIMKSRKTIVQTKFKDTTLRQETRISSTSILGLSVLIVAYSYFLFFRNFESMIENLHTIEMFPITFLKLAIPIFILPFVLLGYFFLFPPYATYTLTTSELLCHMGIVRARIPLNTITRLEKETKLERITHRVPFLIRLGTIINCVGPFTWSNKIKHDQIVIFASEDFNQQLQEVSHRSMK